MTLEEKIRIIEEKIANLPAEFTEEEEYIITNNPRILKLFQDTLLNTPELCTMEIISSINYSMLGFTDVQERHIFTQVVNNLLEEQIYSIEELESICEQLKIDGEKREYFKKIVKDGYNNPEFSIERFHTSESSIKEMLFYKRYDLISQLEIYDISKELAEQIWREYPFDNMPFPKVLAKSSEFAVEHLEDFPDEILLIAYFNHGLKINNGFVQKKIEEIKNTPRYIEVVLKRISQIERIDLSYFTETEQYFNQILIPCDYTQKLIADEEIVKKLYKIAHFFFKNGIYEIGSELYKKQIVSIKEIREIIIEAAKKVGETGEYELFNKFHLIDFINDLEDDVELATILLENGLVEDAKLIHYDITDKKREYIIEQLKKKNKKFEKYGQTILLRREIFETKLGTKHELDEEMYKVKLASGFVKNIYTDGYEKYTEKDLAIIESIINSYPNIEYHLEFLTPMQLVTLADTLLKNNKIDTIISYINKNKAVIDKDFIISINKTNQITELIKNNTVIGLKLFKAIPKVFLSIPEIMDTFLSYDFYLEKILEFVNHHEDLEYFYSEEIYQKYRGLISKKTNISPEKLDKIKDVFGPQIIRYSDNENIHELSTLSSEELDKLLALFPEKKFTFQDLEGAYDTLKQYEFSQKNPEDAQIFPRLLHAIEDKNYELITNLCNKIASELDQNFFNRLSQNYTIPEEYINSPLALVKFVIEKINVSQAEKLIKYKNLLHEMTNYYISKKREKYRNTYNMEEELNLPYTLDEKSTETVLIRYVINYSAAIETNIVKDDVVPTDNQMAKPKHYRLDEYLIKRLIENGVSPQIAQDTLNYYIHKDKTICSDYKEAQKNISKLIKIVKEIINPKNVNDYSGIYRINENVKKVLIEEAAKKGEIRRIYNIPQTNRSLEILTRLNVSILQKNVLKNSEVYESLLRTIQKRKIHLIPDNLTQLLGSEYINISTDLANIAGFISHYASIYNEAKENNEKNGKSTDNIMLNITNILIKAAVYSGISSVYSQILGDEDAKLIKANPGKNSATRKLANDGRLKEAVKLTATLYNRQKVTIPTFVENISIDGNKKLKAIVGNFTHPSNLTHGERTEACMRIGGVGESLFQFALKNENGFHIRFEDPDTGKYISRVTGFRNGNTVFLNELRDSCDSKEYSNLDVVKACRGVAQMLIDLSKGSSCPIENVVIHNDYAMRDEFSEMVYLNVESIKEGLPHFYSDVGPSAIVLATTATNAKYTPLNFDKTNVPSYLPAREKALASTTLQEASSRINRVASIKRLLAGENYEYIEPYQFPDGLIYAITADDWYVYVDENGKIIKDIIDIDPRAKEELAQAIIEVENTLSQTHEEKEEVNYGL